MSETMGNWFGIETKVIDSETGFVMPDGTEGELCVRGFAALQGYYKKEREDVFDRDGWLHTGDRVTRVDGVVQFVGRYTEMIKSQGANVSPRELEVLLESYDEIRHAVVVGLPHQEQEEQVVAVVVPAPGHDVQVDRLLERMRSSVSSYKVPSRVEVVHGDNDIPWLPTGKPDRRALRDRLVASSS
jgi:acyl-CoA synthetase (AMP-forming)/AMP-acid ligase II